MSLPPTNQPTNQPPTSYISARVTMSHERVQHLLDACVNYYYIIYPHLGTGRDNPHYHILILSDELDRKFVERVRKHLKTKLELTGNGQIRVKLETNGLLQGIQYCSKENTKPYVSHQHLERYILEAPAWVQQPNIGAYLKKPLGREPNPDHYRIINSRNLEKVTLRYRQQQGIKSDQLEDTLEHMHRHGGYRLCDSLYRNGILQTYFDTFTAICRGQPVHSSWTFLRLARPCFDHKS